jgi:phosphate starvation-inducible PhoH-like protein
MTRISLTGRTDELFGVKDENLRSLEEILKVRIKNDGADLIIEGSQAAERQAQAVLLQLTTMMANGYNLAGGDVRLAATLISENESADIKDFLLKAVVRSGKKTIVPRSFNQRRYLEQIISSDMVFGIGPAGTGKTYLAVAQAVSYLHTRRRWPGSSWPGPRWKRARSSASCPATFNRRSIPTSVRCTTRSTT